MRDNINKTEEIRAKLIESVFETLLPYVTITYEEAEFAANRLISDLISLFPASGTSRGIHIGVRNKCGFVGVRYKGDSRKKRYQAVVEVNDKKIRSGHFATPEEAAARYDELVREHRGGRGPFNFPRAGELGFARDVDLDKSCPYGHSREIYGRTCVTTGQVSCRACNLWAVERYSHRSRGKDAPTSCNVIP